MKSSTICHVSLCLTKDSFHPFRANVAQWGCAKNNLDLNVVVGQKSTALCLLLWDWRYVRMALCGGGQKSLCVRVTIAPAAQEEHPANVPAPLPGPPWCIHSWCECICAAVCGAVEAVLYLLTQKRRDMRAMTWKSGLTRWMFCYLFVCSLHYLPHWRKVIMFPRSSGNSYRQALKWYGAAIVCSVSFQSFLKEDVITIRIVSPCEWGSTSWWVNCFQSKLI